MTEKIHTGDNLEFMQSLPDGCIDLIYCDILYGTGRDFGEYKDLTSNKSVIYDFYQPRIKEMHRILSDTGSIYLQMDTRIPHWIRCIMDDVFGYNNFRNEIPVKKRSNANNTISAYFPKNHDVILFYTKGKKYTFNTEYLPLSEDSIKRYGKADEKGRRYMLNSMQRKKTCKLSTLSYKGKDYTGEWIWSQETLNKRINEVEVNSIGDLAYRMYLKDSKGVQLSDFWEDMTFEPSDKNTQYPTEKNPKLMQRIIKVGSNEGDTCADFFCGSGSFGAAAKKLNRNVVLCDINPNATKIAREKLNNASDLFNSI